MALRDSLRLACLAALAGLAQGAAALDLVDAWQAAVRNDRDHAVERATQAAAQPRRDQASALWRPNVGVTASLGLASNDTETRGAQFSAPGFGQSTGVGFATSVSNGTSGRWAVTATQPLYNRERRAQQRQLNLSVDAADVAWQAAGQSLMLRTAERYFDAAVADEAVRVLQLQVDAVQAAATEAQDRFTLGASPITETHEARARLAGVRAQLLAAESDRQIKRSLLADSTGLPLADLAVHLPVRPGPQGTPAPRPLAAWLAEAQVGNPRLRGQRLAADIAQQEADKLGQRLAPTVDLVAQAGRDRLSGSGDFGSASNTGSNRMIGVQLSVPLFTGGYRDARSQEAAQLALKAAAEVERTGQQVAQQVLAAWLGVSVGAERVQSLDEALVASTSRRDATQLGREVGQRTTLDVLNAENDIAAARLALAQGRVALLMDRLRLAALAGRLDEATLRSVNGELATAEGPPLNRPDPTRTP